MKQISKNQLSICAYALNVTHMVWLAVILYQLIQPYVYGVMKPDSIAFHDATDFIEKFKFYLNVIMPIYLTTQGLWVWACWHKQIRFKIHIPTVVGCLTLLLIGVMALYVSWYLQVPLNGRPLGKFVWWL